MDRVTRAEAARVMSVDRATITRWVQKNPALLDEAGLVSLEELRVHHDQVINPKLQTRVQAQNRLPELLPSPSGRDNLNDTRNRTEAAKAHTAELDLADRLRLTLRRDDVEAAVAAAAEVLKQTAQAIVRDRAEALTRIDDPREMERVLDELMREVLTKGSQALSLAAVSTEGAHAA